jgi:thermosome
MSRGQPIMILKEGSTRSRGTVAQRGNITAAKIIAELIKSSLGPRGMDKMLVDSLGDITITNDGYEILDEADIEHPAAKIIVEVAKTQDEVAGDGTTTAVVLAGALLKRAEELLDKKIHPSAIVTGYRKASDESIRVLRKLALEIDRNDKDVLQKVAETAMHGKATDSAKTLFSDIAIKAVNLVAEEKDDTLLVDKDDIQLVKSIGKGLLDSYLVQGLIIDKEIVHPDMPKLVEDAKIAVIDTALEIEKPEFDARIRLRDPTQIRAFLDEEERLLQEMVEKITATGANVIMCQRGIDDLAQHYLMKNGVLSVRRIKMSDVERLSKATGAKIVTNLDEMSSDDLGWAELVREEKIGEDTFFFVEGCKNPRAVSIMMRAGFERMLDEAERSMQDGIGVLVDVLKENKVVAGGGSIEVELAKQIRDFSTKISGREQLAVEAFAEALEEIPTVLSENAGLDPIDIMVELRASHEKEGGTWFGVNVLSGEVANMMDLGVLEPIIVKEQAIKSAVEATSMILRIDDMIASSKAPPAPQQPPGAEYY